MQAHPVALVAGILIAAPIVILASPTTQANTCAGAYTYTTGVAMSTVDAGESDFYTFDGRTTYTLVSGVNPLSHVTTGGDVDLFVYDLGCTRLLCSSKVHTDPVDRCIVQPTSSFPPGIPTLDVFAIEVRYVSSTDPNFPHVDYTLIGV